MEITKTSFRGCEVSVIFTGSHYYFHSSYYGLLAVAVRDYDREVSMDYQTGTGAASFFTLITGNHNTIGGCLGGSVVASLCERYIRKLEQRYITKSVSFGHSSQDLTNTSLVCSLA